MPEEYTNRELGILIKEGFKGVHERQDKTNGKVLNAEKDIKEINKFKNKSLGAMIIINVILIPLTFIVLAQMITNHF